MPDPATDQRAAFTLSPDEVLEHAAVDARAGLSNEEAAARRATYGPNRFAEGKSEPAWRAFVRQYRELMQIVLLAAGNLSIWPVGQPRRASC